MATGHALRIANGLGRGLEKFGMVPDGVSAGGLIDEVLEFDEKLEPGDPRLEPALRRLTRACDEEAQLSPVGRLAARRQLVELLDNLIRMRAARHDNPGIAAETVGRPVFITGLPRTGSTFLHSLLAQDPRVRVPMTWEVMRPPISRQDNSGNVRYCEKRLRWAHRLAPSFRAIHPMGAHLPQECIAITAYVFRSIVFHTTQHIPSYQNWLENADHKPVYRFHRRFLQYLQFFGASGRWVLKAPGHMFGIRALLDVNPGAVIVQTHRDPVRVAASLASHTTVLRSAFSNAVRAPLVASDWLERWWRATDQLLDVREEHPDAFVDVRYSDVVGDPLGVVEHLYRQLGWALSPQARRRMQAFMAANPKGKHGEHRYSLDAFGLSRDALLNRLDRYRSTFSIQEEPLPM